MSRRVAAAAATLLIALASAGCGSSKSEPAGLSWVKRPQLIRYPTLPRDRTATGEVRNMSKKAFRLDAREVHLLDGRGHRIPLTVTSRFLAGFAHGLYSPTQFGQVQNAFELQRLGVKVELAPQQVRPLSVAWRVQPGSPQPARVQIGRSSLPLPTR